MLESLGDWALNEPGATEPSPKVGCRRTALYPSIPKGFLIALRVVRGVEAAKASKRLAACERTPSSEVAALHIDGKHASSYAPTKFKEQPQRYR